MDGGWHRSITSIGPLDWLPACPVRSVMGSCPVNALQMTFLEGEPSADIAGAGFEPATFGL